MSIFDSKQPYMKSHPIKILVLWLAAMWNFGAIKLTAQTNWSKVGISQSNACNLYSFEITGVTDSCFNAIDVEFVDRWADPVYRTFNKKFNAIFKDTGTYYGTIQIKNKCNKDDTFIYITLKVSCKPEKCDWFSATLKQYNQNRFYQWQLWNVFPDSCLNYQYRFYDFQTGKTDTATHYNGLCNYNFKTAGKYRMTLNIVNSCKNCDTVFTKEIIILPFYTARLQTQVFQCDSISGFMNSLAADPKDSCWKYQYRIYSDAFLDTISDARWNDTNNTDIYQKYAFNESSLMLATSNGRLLRYRFPKMGRYILYAQWNQVCFSQDTLIYRRFEIPDCYAHTKEIYQSAGLGKIIGLYNTIGQTIPLDLMAEENGIATNTTLENLLSCAKFPKNQLVFVKFANGTTIKVYVRE